MAYEFPLNNPSFQYIQNREQLTKLLKASEKTPSQFQQFYCSISGNVIRAMCRIKSCKARLVYQRVKQSQYYQLKQFRNCHIHNLKINKKILSQAQKVKQIQNLLKNGKYKQMEPLKFKLEIKKNYGIQFTKIQQIIDELYKKQQNFLNLTEQLKQKGCQMWYVNQIDQLIDYPDCLIVITQDMKKDYQRYGQFTCFKTFKSIIQLERKAEHQYEVGVLLGQNCGRQIIVFAVMINKVAKPENYEILILKAIELLDSIPNCIITDFSESLEELIDRVNASAQLDITHIYDSASVISVLSANLKQKQSINSIYNLIEASHQKKYSELLGEYYRNFNGFDIKILQYIAKNSQKICFSQYPKVLSGIGKPFKFGDSFVSSAKQVFQIPKSYYRYVYKLVQYAEQFKANQGPIYIGLGGNTETSFTLLKSLQNRIQSSIFKILVERYKDANQSQIFQLKKSVANQQFHYRVLQGQYDYKVFLRGKRWKCQCAYLQRAGIPCCHLIKVCITRFQKLENYIARRWIIQGDTIEVEKKQKKTEFEIDKPLKKQNARDHVQIIQLQ